VGYLEDMEEEADKKSETSMKLGTSDYHILPTYSLLVCLYYDHYCGT
jgi:hypothetical protein